MDREGRPSTAFRSMPHYRDWFAVEASKAVIHPNYRREDSKASAYVDEDVDGFMKLGDIKGEFASKAVIHPNYRPTNGSQDVGSWTLQDNTFRGPKTDEVGWDVGPVGDAAENFAGAYSNSLGGFKADALTNGGQEGFSEVEIHYVGPVNQTADVWTTGPVTSIKNTAPSDYNHGKRSNWDVICDIGTSIKQDGIDLQSDALVQQVNDFAGLINPDSMRPAEHFSHNPEWFAPGSAVESLVSNSNQMFSPISGEGVFAQRDGLEKNKKQTK